MQIRVKHFGTLEGLMNLGPEDVQIWLFNYMKVRGVGGVDESCRRHAE